MRRLMIAITVASIASVSSAQTTTGDRKQGAAPAAEKAKSKEVPKMTAAEKDKMAKDVNPQLVNPDNPSGSVAGTAAMQKAPRTGDFPPYGPRKVRPFIGGGPEISGK